MPRFVQLHTASGNTLFINPNCVSQFFAFEDHTMIYLMGCENHKTVIETPEEIAKLLEDTNAGDLHGETSG